MTSTRRAFLTAAGCAGLFGVGVTGTSGKSDISRDSFTIRSGTDQATKVFVTTASQSGPTVMVTGGMHGNEEGGYTAAGKIAKWDIARGRLVVIPRANAAADRQDSRVASGGVDLNRQFPTGSEPNTKLARAIWSVVEKYNPDIVIDLHESHGVFDGDMVGGVGQAIFRSWDQKALDKANATVSYVNDHYVSRDGYDFVGDPFSSTSNNPTGLFSHKAARDTDAIAFLVETTSKDTPLDKRVQWHTKIVQQLVEDDILTGRSGGNGGNGDSANGNGTNGNTGNGDSANGNTGDKQNKPPVARIETTPKETSSESLKRGDTVTLDASASKDKDGDITEYMWDIDGDGSFEKSGESIRMPLPNCGTYRVTLQVTDDKGATDTDTVDLSTVK